MRCFLTGSLRGEREPSVLGKSREGFFSSFVWSSLFSPCRQLSSSRPFFLRFFSSHRDKGLESYVYSFHSYRHLAFLWLHVEVSTRRDLACMDLLANGRPGGAVGLCSLRLFSFSTITRRRHIYKCPAVCTHLDIDTCIDLCIYMHVEKPRIPPVDSLLLGSSFAGLCSFRVLELCPHLAAVVDAFFFLVGLTSATS